MVGEGEEERKYLRCRRGWEGRYKGGVGGG